MNRSRQRSLQIAVLALVLAVAYLAGRWDGWRDAAGPAKGADAGQAAEAAFAARLSDVELEIAGEVDRVLADDLEGSRHQRFIVRLASGQTVLVAHNIDLAERVPLRRGDRVTARGEYEWNERGGVLHWTHHDPRGRRVGGWIRHGGREYR